MRPGYSRNFALRRASLAFAAALAVLAAGPAAADLFIFRPRIGVPAFAETGGVFQVEVVTSAGLSSNDWTAKLTNDLREWTCTVEQATYGTCIYNNSTTGWSLRVRVPADISPEVFRLIVSHPSGGTATNSHCVKIVPSFESDFYAVHYADPQASASNALSASGMNTPYGSIQEMYWHTPVFNLINPRFLFDTGDELDDGDVDTANRYRQYLAAMETLTVPLLITRGNNDRGDFGHWRTNIGQATYSMTMGSFFVAMKDYNSNDGLAGFTNEYASSFGNTNILYRLFGQHYSSGASAYAPPAGQYPNLMLVGHLHGFATVQSVPYHVLLSGPAHNYGAASLFEFNRSGTNWLCPGMTNHPAGTQFYAVGDWGAPNVTSQFAYANDGTGHSNTARIVNSLSLRFRDGRLRFLVRRASGGYRVSGGEKLAEYDYANGSNSAVVVKVDIASGTTTTVSVQRVDTDADGMDDEWELTHFHDLATAGAATDSDGDTQLDWEEYVAGSEPTNNGSAWEITDARPAAGAAGLLIRWPSLSNRLYAVAAAGDLFTDFTSLASNLPASPPENTYTDTVWSVESSAFYRVRARLP